MSSELGPSVSINAGATIFGFEVYGTSPGWQGILVWVPHAQQVSTLNYDSEYVALESDGTFHFGKNITNNTGTTIDFDVEYTYL